jgi:hypothetical protein
MYNLIFGRNPMSDMILATLGLKKEDCGRFRDCFIFNNEIAIYTRNGGGNREYCQNVFDTLEKHSCYLRDEDDDFDCTYATIYFKFPEEYKEELSKLSSAELFDPSKMWLDALEALKGKGNETYKI